MTGEATAPVEPPQADKAVERRTIVAVSLFAASLGGLLWQMRGYYFWAGHEEYFSLYRTQQMVEVWLSGGGLTARWLADACFGYGWPFFTFYAPFGYFVAGALHVLFGFNIGLSVKLSFFLSLAFSGAAMGALGWLLARRSGSRQPEFWGLAAAILSTFAPYHMTDVFVRSALAECWAWAFLSAAVLGAELLRTRPRLGGAVFALSVGGLAVSHNITSLYGCLVLAAYGLFSASWGDGAWRWIVRLACGGALGLGLAAWFWLPALVLMPCVQAHDVNAFYGSPEWLRVHALYWPQFFMEQWNFGASRAGMDDTLALNPGLLIMAGGMLAGFALFQRALPRASKRPIVASLVLSLFLLFAMTHAMPWEWVPGMLRYIQFPWRMEVLVVTLLVVALASGAAVVERRVTPWVFIIFPVAMAFWMLDEALVTPDHEVNADAELPAFNRLHEYGQGLIAGCNGGEYRPVWASPHFVDKDWQAANPAPRDRILASTETLAVHAYGREGARYRWLVSATTATTAIVHVFDFPGWVLRIDGVVSPQSLRRTAGGLLAIGVPGGEHEVQLQYGAPPIALRAAAISWAAAAAMFLWMGLEFHFARRRARSQPAHSS